MPPLTAKYAPKDKDHLLFFIGQDLESIEAYTSNVAPDRPPSGITTYTCIQDKAGASLNGLETPIDYGAGTVHARALLNKFPHSVLAIGLDIVDRSGRNLDRIVKGKLDDRLDELGEFIRALARPVFLRVGYEFDGEWNHYEPDKYRAAFRKIVTHLRDVRRVPNFVSVWQSATSRWGTYRGKPITAWWPGEDVVDWLGSSYFEFCDRPWKNLVKIAKQYGKPILVCEAAPQGFDIENETRSDTAGVGEDKKAMSHKKMWDKWYKDFFSFVKSNRKIIRGVAYINCDWKSQQMWSPTGGNGYWGDSRVNISDVIRTRWEREIVQCPPWLSADAQLFSKLT